MKLTFPTFFCVLCLFLTTSCSEPCIACEKEGEDVVEICDNGTIAFETVRDNLKERGYECK